MTDQIARPWALMRHHAGWADVFLIEKETQDSITGVYPDRETVGPPVNYSVRAILARPDAWRVRTFVEPLAQAV